jgi:hypothetical protein
MNYVWGGEIYARPQFCSPRARCSRRGASPGCSGSGGKGMWVRCRAAYALRPKGVRLRSILLGSLSAPVRPAPAGGEACVRGHSVPGPTSNFPRRRARLRGAPLPHPHPHNILVAPPPVPRPPRPPPRGGGGGVKAAAGQWASRAANAMLTFL